MTNNKSKVSIVKCLRHYPKLDARVFATTTGIFVFLLFIFLNPLVTVFFVFFFYCSPCHLMSNFFSTLLSAASPFVWVLVLFDSTRVSLFKYMLGMIWKLIYSFFGGFREIIFILIAFYFGIFGHIPSYAIEYLKTYSGKRQNSHFIVLPMVYHFSGSFFYGTGKPKQSFSRPHIVVTTNDFTFFWISAIVGIE